MSKHNNKLQLVDFVRSINVRSINLLLRTLPFLRRHTDVMTRLGVCSQPARVDTGMRRRCAVDTRGAVRGLRSRAGRQLMCARHRGVPAGPMYSQTSPPASEDTKAKSD